MKKKLIRFILILVYSLEVFSFSSVLYAAAQTSDIIRDAGDISGTVTYCSQRYQDMLIYMRGTSYNATTDGNGDFYISYVQQGTYDLVVKKEGLTLGTIPQVNVIKKQLTLTGLNEFCNDLDGDGYSPPADCNDNNTNINPNITEVCDGVDNNCNDLVDEGCQICTDGDGDGYFAQNDCGTPVDCNDSNASINPNASEICDNIDNNCNNSIDEIGSVGEITYYKDNDGDSYGDSSSMLQACGSPTGYVSNDSDCDDTNVSINPDANEIFDGLDNNCDGQIDNVVCGLNITHEALEDYTFCTSNVFYLRIYADGFPDESTFDVQLYTSTQNGEINIIADANFASSVSGLLVAEFSSIPPGEYFVRYRIAGCSEESEWRTSNFTISVGSADSDLCSAS